MRKAPFLGPLVLYLGWQAARRLPPERKGDVVKLVNRVFEDCVRAEPEFSAASQAESV